MPVVHPDVASTIACGSQVERDDERFFRGNGCRALRETDARNQACDRKWRFPSWGNHETFRLSQSEIPRHLSAVRGRSLRRGHAFALPQLYGFRCTALHIDVPKIRVYRKYI